MEPLWNFITNSVLLGVGLAADAFSVSVVNGIKYPHLKKSKAVEIAGMFAFFQALMPMTGWFMAHSIMNYFQTFQKALPMVSKVFLLYLGCRVILESVDPRPKTSDSACLTMKELLIQAVATSVDALLIGFTIASYSVFRALICSGIIAAVTFVICYCGVHCGKELGLKLVGKASFVSGLILIFIALRNGV